MEKVLYLENQVSGLNIRCSFLSLRFNNLYVPSQNQNSPPTYSQNKTSNLIYLALVNPASSKKKKLFGCFVFQRQGKKSSEQYSENLASPHQTSFFFKGGPKKITRSFTDDLYFLNLYIKHLTVARSISLINSCSMFAE